MTEQGAPVNHGRQLVLMTLLSIVAYIFIYGLCRWQKILVYQENYAIGFKQGPLVRHVGPRSRWAHASRGRLDPVRDFLTEPVFFIFRPLAALETRLRQ